MSRGYQIISGDRWPDESAPKRSDRARRSDNGADRDVLDVTTTKATSKRQRFTPVAIDDIVLGEEPPYLVDGIIPAGPSLTVIVGKDKAGKSFLMTDMLFHVAMGRPYLGREVQQGAVVYITSEGIGGVNRRLTALRRHYGVEGQGKPFYHVRKMVNLGDRRDVAALISDLKATVPQPIVAIAIDPLIRAMPGKSDSETADMNIIADNAEQIARAFGAAVIVGHHTPRGDETRSRGSNVLDGDADAMLSVVKADGVSTVTVYRMKDGPEGLTWKFRLEVFDLGLSAAAKVRTSCVCAAITNPAFEDTSAASAAKRSQKLTADQTRFLDILRKATAEAGEMVKGTASVPTGARAVTRDMVKRYCLTNGYFEPDAKANVVRAGVSKMLNTLAGKHVIGTTADYVWIAQPAQPSAATP